MPSSRSVRWKVGDGFLRNRKSHGFNVLVLDPKTVCVEKSEVYQAEQMDKLGMEVVEVELRDAYAFGGGLHCCTADVYREGSCEDYFPKM